MAKRSYAGSGRWSGRKLFLGAALVVLVGLAGWRVFFEKSLPGVDKNKIRAEQKTDLIDPAILVVTEQKPMVRKMPAVKGTAEKQQPKYEPGVTEVKKSVPVAVAAQKSRKGQESLRQGRAACKAKDYITARMWLSKAVAEGLNEKEEREARKLINRTTDGWLFSGEIYSGDKWCSQYRVVSGDSLTKIARKYAVTYPLLMRINQIKSAKNLAAGQRLKVVQGPFRVVVDRKRFLMSVYLGDLLVRSYSVTIGAPGRETPTGLWKVELKQLDPEWVDPDTNKRFLPHDPQNPLGNRWIALKGQEGKAVGETGFGIHGTIEPDKIGTAASRGCIRLLNKEVGELYNMLVVGKSLVRVEN